MDSREASERRMKYSGQGLGIGQRRGDDLGPLLLGVGVRTSGAGQVLQGGPPAVVESADPGRDGGPRDVQLLGDLTDPTALGGGQDDPGAFRPSGSVWFGSGPGLRGRVAPRESAHAGGFVRAWGTSSRRIPRKK